MGPGGRDFLQGSVGASLLYLSVPVLGEQFLHLLVGLTDTYLAGTVSKEATAAIGLATQMGWLIGLLFNFIGVGATALVARHAGMRAYGQANHFANQAVAIALLMGIAEAVGTWLAAPLLPGLLGWDSEPTRIAVQYLRIDSFGYILYSITVITAACWRGMGDMRTPLYIMLVVNVINMVTSTALRFGWGPVPNLGVTGIAVGTLAARLLGGGIVLALIVRGRGGIRLGRPELRPQRDLISRILRVGVPAGLDGILLWMGQFFFLMIISALERGSLQAATVAAHFVGIRVEAFSYLPAYAWGTAAATMVGQSLGAGLPRRAARSGHLAALQGAVTCAVMGVLYFIFAEQIYAMFNASEDAALVASIGVPALRRLAFFQVPLALMIIYINALRGAGDTRVPLLFTVFGMVICRLPLAYLFGIVLHGGLVGAWTGMFADMSARAVLSTIRFARGKWKLIKV